MVISGQGILIKYHMLYSLPREPGLNKFKLYDGDPKTKPKKGKVVV